MTWTPPHSEDEWAEWLSAFVDGELDDEDANALRALIDLDPARQAQVAALRELSQTLQDWRAPDVAVPRTIAGSQSRKASPMRWWPVAAGFAAGLLTAWAALTAVPRPQPVQVVQITQQPNVRPASDITTRQADVLIREAAANALRAQIEQLVAERELEKAEDRLATLQRDYADTHAAATTTLNVLIDRARERQNWRERRT